MNEAGILAMEGTPIAAIDKALLDFGMPMGPFRLMDEGCTMSRSDSARADFVTV